MLEKAACKVMFELLPDGSEGASSVDFCGRITPGRDNSRIKGPAAVRYVV